MATSPWRSEAPHTCTGKAEGGQEGRGATSHVPVPDTAPVSREAHGARAVPLLHRPGPSAARSAARCPTHTARSCCPAGRHAPQPAGRARTPLSVSEPERRARRTLFDLGTKRKTFLHFSDPPEPMLSEHTSECPNSSLMKKRTCAFQSRTSLKPGCDEWPGRFWTTVQSSLALWLRNTASHSASTVRGERFFRCPRAPHYQVAHHGRSQATQGARGHPSIRDGGHLP